MVTLQICAIIITKLLYITHLAVVINFCASVNSFVFVLHKILHLFLILII